MQLDTSLSSLLKSTANKEYITNLSINSLAAVRFTIYRNLTPWAQLRQCEQIIFEKTTAIEDSCFSLQEKEAEFALKTSRLASLQSFGDNSAEESIEKRKIEAELFLLNNRKERIRILLRDAAMELQVAAEEKEKILQQNPEFSQGTFEELQEKYSGESLNAKIAAHLAIKMLALNGIPEEFAAVLVELPPEQWKPILDQANSLFVKAEEGLKSNQPMIGASHQDSLFPNNDTTILKSFD